jgi:hypothetical protein
MRIFSWANTFFLGGVLAISICMLPAGANAAPGEGLSPTLSLAAVESTPGATLSISGSGFKAGEQVKISLLDASTQVVANGSGQFAGAGLVVPTVPSGSFQLTAVGQSSRAVASSYVYIGSFYPNIEPSAFFVQPGTILNFSGTGFAPSEVIEVGYNFQGTTQTLPNISANSSGQFNGLVGFAIPSAWQGKSATFTMRGLISDSPVEAVIGVGSFNSLLTPSSYYVHPGQAITFSGSGFHPGETIRISSGSNSVEVGANSSGSFSNMGSLVVPFSAAGSTFNVLYLGQTSGVQGTISIPVSELQTALTPNTYYTLPGSVITLSGTGFASNEAVTIQAGSQNVQATANASGSFSNVTLTIPASTQASQHIVATGQVSAAVAETTITLGVVSPYMQVNEYYVTGGTPIIVSGYNFLPGEQVKVKLGEGEEQLVTANGGGSFILNTVAPFAAPGQVAVKGTGVSSMAIGATELTIAKVWVGIQVAAYAGKPGAPVTFEGSGYLPNEPIEIYTSKTGTTPVFTFTANNAGSFSNSGFIIPSDWQEIALTLFVKGLYSFTNNSIVYYVTSP